MVQQGKYKVMTRDDIFKEYSDILGKDYNSCRCRFSGLFKNT